MSRQFPGASASTLVEGGAVPASTCSQISQPRERRVVGRVAGLSNREDQPPLHGPTMNPRDEPVEEIVFVGIGGLSRIFQA